jgi:hypothetical protein
VQTLGGFPAPSLSATCVAENGGASREAPINRRFLKRRQQTEAPQIADCQVPTHKVLLICSPEPSTPPFAAPACPERRFFFVLATDKHDGLPVTNEEMLHAALAHQSQA